MDTDEHRSGVPRPVTVAEEQIVDLAFRCIHAGEERLPELVDVIHVQASEIARDAYAAGQMNAARSGRN